VATARAAEDLAENKVEEKGKQLNMEAGYLSLKELASYSSLSESSLRSLIRSGEIPCFRVVRKILVKRSDFDYWARRRQRRPRDVDPMAKKIFDEITASI
jgi:excisionase family DNA binding protein